MDTYAVEDTVVVGDGVAVPLDVSLALSDARDDADDDTVGCPLTLTLTEGDDELDDVGADDTEA